MKLIERYLFRQLLWPLLLAVAALSVMALVCQAISSFQFVDARPKTLLVLLQVTGLAYPQLLSLILPIALFVSTAIVMRRLSDDREIIICYSSGLDRWGVIAPAALLGLAAMVLALALNLWIAPPAARTMRYVIRDARADLAASFIRPGEFVQPAPGLTLYAQKLETGGHLRNVFLHQQGSYGGSTYLARTAELVVGDGRAALVMHRGSNQRFSSAGVLNFVSFEQWTFDLTPFLAKPPAHLELSDYGIGRLIHPGRGDAWAAAHRPMMLAEANSRLAGPIYGPAFMFLALAGALAAPFDRRGAGWAMAIAALAAGAARVAGFGAEALSAKSEAFNTVQYLIPLATGAAALAVLFRTRLSRPTLPRRAPTPLGFAGLAAPR